LLNIKMRASSSITTIPSAAAASMLDSRASETAAMGKDEPILSSPWRNHGENGVFALK
jgi:hypothetical protein